MKTINCIAIYFMICTLCSCQSCYSVHEKQTPIDISFAVDGKILLNVQAYIDSLNVEHKIKDSPCRPTAIETEPTDKILCLTNPCECYLVSFRKDMIKIQAVFIPTIDDRAWLIMKEYVPAEEFTRIEYRFTKDILNRNDN